ncbi:membrane or secreted protein [methanotrophic bacterial endosymbiont of Bathymodiolus sp.]|jgi:hypothetical protein|nr:membrane or secreted protein [methanotrophic bacterial endosymbiont of Bathymodiolus sp.]
MSKPLRSIIGLLLLITTVSLATCQSLYQVTPFGNTSGTMQR